MSKRVQFPRGTREEEDGVTGLEGEIRIDLTAKEIRIHDGQRQGGYPLASREYVDAKLAGGGDESSGLAQVAIFASTAELKSFQPSVSVLAVLREEGVEDSFVWQQGLSAPGDIPSDISGYWKRLDGQASLAIKFLRAKLINMQVDGTQPAANQATTAWLINDQLKLWDGDSYENATPALWMRLFASVGGYSTETFALPDRLQASLVQVTNLNTITETGWYKTSAGATGNPVPVVNQVLHMEMSATLAIQRVVVHNDTNKGEYIRYRTSNAPVTWTAFTYVGGELAARLRASQTESSDVNTALESGFYRFPAGTANSPFSSGKIGVYVTRFDANNVTQIAIGSAGDVAARSRISGTFTSWVTLSEVGHTHDDRYYTEAEVTSLLAGKAASVHTHDDRYYTESEMNTLLAGKSSTSHTHDTRYYTEDEVDSLLAPKLSSLVVSSHGAVGSYVALNSGTGGFGGALGSTGALTGFSGTWRLHGQTSLRSDGTADRLYQRIS